VSDAPSAFLDPLRVEQVDWRAGRPVFMTIAPLRYRSARLGCVVVIPPEFVTDLASVPRLPIIWLATGGRGPRSAVVHDYPYQTGYWLLEAGGQLEVEKPVVDEVYHESLLADPISGAGPVRAWEMWAGVRVNVAGGVWGDRARAARLNPLWESSGWPQA
jgi:hypothetical protein